MSAPDPRTPVIVGVAQLNQHPADPGDAREAVAMMADVVARAASDAAAPGLAAKLELIAAVAGGWRYSDPARIVADRVGARHARTALTTDGGNSPGMLINLIAERIWRGELAAAAVVGAETIWSRRRLRSAGVDRELTMQAGVEPDERIGPPLVMSDDLELSRHLAMPIDVYPLFDSAIRHRRGESVTAHRDRLAGLWAGFNQVAVTNPYSWSRTPMTAAEIREATPDNRMVSFPYTKAMCSNWDLDQAAAVIVCSAEVAAAAGVPRDRWVFCLGGAEADDTTLISHRRDLGRSPAIAAAFAALTENSGIGAEDISHLDLYSCFPSAVEAACEAMGIDETRSLTVTGGLTFAGGPLNNYVTHSTAAMVEVLRDDAESIGLVTANGGFLTKHALGLYTATPGDRGFTRTTLRPDQIEHHARPSTAAPGGPGVVEAATVTHDRDGPVRALFGVLLPDGARSWGWTEQADTMAAVMTDGLVGATAHVEADGRTEIG